MDKKSLTFWAGGRSSKIFLTIMKTVRFVFWTSTPIQGQRPQDVQHIFCQGLLATLWVQITVGFSIQCCPCRHEQQFLPRQRKFR